MLKFISFGSGSSGNCYLLATPTDALLIDIGVGLRGLKKACRDYGVSLSSVKHVLVTHDHADHIKSVGAFSNDYQVPIYATREVHNGINRNYCVVKKVATDLVRLVEKGKTLQLGDFTVTPFAVPHDSLDNVGYFIEAEGTNFCLMTDAGCVTDEMKQYISQARHLVIEANHDIEQLKNVWLCHLSEENNHPELARKTVESVLRSYGIVVGTDVRLEVLKRTTPTGPFELH